MAPKHRPLSRCKILRFGLFFLIFDITSCILFLVIYIQIVDIGHDFIKLFKIQAGLCSSTCHRRVGIDRIGSWVPLASVLGVILFPFLLRLASLCQLRSRVRFIVSSTFVLFFLFASIGRLTAWQMIEKTFYRQNGQWIFYNILWH